MEPETSSPRTISMPLAVTSLRPWARCGLARPTIMSAPAKIGSIQINMPILLRPRRATSRARLTSEYSMAATGPRRPRHNRTSGSSASNQNHSGCRNRVMSLLRGSRLLGLCGFQHECTGALTQGLHVIESQRQRGEFDEVALVEEFTQQRLMLCERRIGALQQVVEKFLRGLAGRRDVESLLDIAAN